MSRKSHTTRLMAAAFCMIPLTATAEIANPVYNFAKCAGRLSAMVHYGSETFGDKQSFRPKFTTMVELLDAAMPVNGDVKPARVVRNDAERSFIYLLDQERFAFDANLANHAERTVRRLLAECDKLMLG
ncbi:MAG: hypothetical protein AAF727_15910 [Pseudomonadota bacterium]